MERWPSWDFPPSSPVQLSNCSLAAGKPSCLPSFEFWQQKTWQGTFLSCKPRAFAGETDICGDTSDASGEEVVLSAQSSSTLDLTLSLETERFCYSVVLGTAVRGGRRRKCLGLVILVLIKSLLERFPNKRTSLVLAGRAGLALHFMLRQCKIESLPNDWLIKE